MSEPSACCAPSVQTSCFEAAATESCCGTSSAAPDTEAAGCAAGATASADRAELVAEEA
jgi:hypothetical protein